MSARRPTPPGQKVILRRGVRHGSEGAFIGAQCRCPTCTDAHERRLQRRRDLAQARQGAADKRSAHERYPHWVVLETLADTVVEPGWQQRATCRPRDGRDFLVDVFFPSSVDQATLEAADAYCNLCPVRYQCLRRELDEGRDRTITAGIYAGTSGPMRVRLRRDLADLAFRRQPA